GAFRRPVCTRNLRDPASRRGPPRHHRGRAFSNHRRVLLSRGRRARRCGDAGLDRARRQPGRDQPCGARPFSPACGRSRPRRHLLGQPVRPLRALGRGGDDAGAHRNPVGTRAGAMKRLATTLRFLFALVATVWLAACNEQQPKYQGWIEANLIFVAPDEMGRVVTLNVREGDAVKAGDPLFTLDDDLQKADLNLNIASLTNARQTFDRAQQLAKSGSGTQKDFDAGPAEMRSAEARVNSAQTRLTRRKLASPVTGTVQQIYFRPGEMVPAGRPLLAILPPGNLKVRFFIPEPVLPRIAYGDTVTV